MEKNCFQVIRISRRKSKASGERCFYFEAVRNKKGAKDMTSQEEQAYLEEIERVDQSRPVSRRLEFTDRLECSGLVFTKAVWNFYPLGVV